MKSQHSHTKNIQYKKYSYLKFTLRQKLFCKNDQFNRAKLDIRNANEGGWHLQNITNQ